MVLDHGYCLNEDVLLFSQIVEYIVSKKGFATVYDVGAHIGIHTLALAKKFQGKIKIRSFEAQRLIYNMLCGTMAINGIANAFCHHCAVSEIDGEQLVIRIPDYFCEQSFGSLELMIPQHSDNQNMSLSGHEIVETRTLDSFNEPVDFIKLDIEGMEDRALKGSVNVIEKHRPILFVETMKTDTDFLLQYLKDHRYKAFKKPLDIIAVPLEEESLGISNVPRIL